MKQEIMEIDIGVSMPPRDSEFMDSVIESQVPCDDSNSSPTAQMTEDEFKQFLDECGIGAERFYNW